MNTHPQPHVHPQISQEDVDNIDSSLIQLQERVQGMSYPPRVVLQAPNGEDPSGLVQVKCALCETLVMEHTFTSESPTKHQLGEFPWRLCVSCLDLCTTPEDC